MAKKIKKIVIIAEKPRAADRIAKILGKNKSLKLVKKKPIRVWQFKDSRAIYRITNVLGHLYATEFSPEVHSKPWKYVDTKWLLTSAPLVKIPRRESKRIISTLRNELKNADVLIIATDYDREGENIGMQIMKFIAKKVNPKITVKRAVFSSLSPKEIREAFKEDNLRDLDWRKIDASEVRQELDLRYGVAFTRLATMKLHDRFGRYDLPLLSIGPCQTPTLGLIVEKYLRHLESLEKAKQPKAWKIKITLNVPLIGELSLMSEPLKSKEEAENLLKNLKKDLLKGLYKLTFEIEQKVKLKRRPLPLNTVRLASLAARYFKIPSAKLLKIAEKLYLEGLISYPRTETEIFPKEIQKFLLGLFNEMKERGIIPKDLMLSKPRAGKKDDKAHPPIHPKRIARKEEITKTLGLQAAKIYDLILRHTIAVFSEDAELLIYKIKFKLGGINFQAEKTLVKNPGYLRVYNPERISLISESISKDKLISLLKKSSVIKMEIIPVKEKVVQPISEAELIRLMDKLGIGTDATFADHINKLVERGYVIRRNGRLIPTEYGLSIALALKEISPKIIDPNIRAEIESYFSKVERGELRKNQAISQAIREFVKIYNEFSASVDDFIDRVVEGVKRVGLRFLIKLRGKKSKRKRP